MPNQTEVAMRKAYREPCLVEYGALTELTRAANGSGAAENKKFDNDGNWIGCMQGNSAQGKKTCA